MALEDVINPADPTGGVPQADMEVVARRLLGDELVNKYGDVIGARKPTLADGLRDFTIAATKGIDTLETLRLKQKEHFQKTMLREQRAAVAHAESERQNVKTVLDAIKTVQGLPPGHRTAILKETLEGMGITPSSAALKMFSDADMIASLPMRDLEQAADDGAIDTGQMAGVFGSGLNAAKFLGEAARRKRDKVATGKLVLDTARTRIRLEDARTKAAVDPREKERRSFLANRLGKMKVTDEATGESRLATADEINLLADRVFGVRAAVTPDPVNQAAARAKQNLDASGATKFGVDALGFSSPATTTTTTTSTPTLQPIPQPAAAPSDEVSAAKKRLGLQ